MIDDAYKVIEILMNELEKHGYGDRHWPDHNYRDPDVVTALTVGRSWLETHAPPIL